MFCGHDKLFSELGVGYRLVVAVVAGQVGEQLEKGGEQDLVESVLGGLSLVEGQLGEPLDQVL